MAYEPFLGEIMIFAGNYAPRGWAFCDGQLLSIAQNQALFSIILTTYGGDGRTNFALPDLRGRFPMHVGQGPGMSMRNLGESGGVVSVNLTVNQLPSHTHQLMATTSRADRDTPSGSLLAAPNENFYASGSAGNLVPLNPNALQVIGEGQPHNNMPPYLCLNFVISLQGLYPSRS